MPSAMMESIRRRFKTSGEDQWATDLPLEPEISEVSELELGRTVLLTSKGFSHQPSNDVDLKSYYKGLIMTAISQGGTYNGQNIAIPWLRMTLAGLEMRPMPPEMMWEGEFEGAPAEMPGFEELFPEAQVP